jgi:predicted component of type VI protein secretion system
MGQIIIKLNGAVVGRVDLKEGDAKVGRRPDCDIVLDHIAVSGEHANITTIFGDSVIEDLNSTNGTFISNKRITKHPLRNGDIVIIGPHALVYTSEPSRAAQDTGASAKKAPLASAAPAEPNLTVRFKHGQLFVLSGANSGKRIDLVMGATTIGRSGTITRTSDGYLLEATSAAETLKLNDRPVPRGGTKLNHGDLIATADARFQFYFK